MSGMAFSLKIFCRENARNYHIYTYIYKCSRTTSYLSYLDLQVLSTWTRWDYECDYQEILVTCKHMRITVAIETGIYSKGMVCLLEKRGSGVR